MSETITLRYKSVLTPTISICIPVFLQSELDYIFLTQCINSVKMQTFQDFELILFTQKKEDFDKCIQLLYPDGEIFDKHYMKKYRIFYKECESAIQNWNNCLEVADGDYVQLLHQDDSYMDKYSSILMLTKLQEQGKKWLIASSANFKEGGFINVVKPQNIVCFSQFKSDICNGKNYWGNPSTIMFENCDLRYDKKLKNCVDIDFLFQLYLQFGAPDIYGEKPLIRIGLHDNQISNTITEEIQEKELEYLKEKYINVEIY